MVRYHRNRSGDRAYVPVLWLLLLSPKREGARGRARVMTSQLNATQIAYFVNASDLFGTNCLWIQS
jgi:hypothetical protein